MKNTKRKGFTIVELVIVIAVIAILAAVLIPTFASLINKANRSADIQAVHQMNTQLAIDEVDSNKTIVDVYAALEEGGMTAKDYHPLASNTYFFWVETLNRIVYTDKEYKVTFPEEYEGKPIATVAGDKAYLSLSGEIEETPVKVTDGKATVSTAEELYWLSKNATGLTEITFSASSINLMGANVSFSVDDKTSAKSLTITGESKCTTINGLVQLTNKLDGADSDAAKKYASGFVANVEQSATLNIKNIIIDGATVGDYDTGTLGVLVGRISNGCNVTVEGCQVKNSTVYGANKVAPLIGSTGGSTVKVSNCCVENCTVNCTEGEAGKVIGCVYNSGAEVTIDRAFSEDWVKNITLNLVEGYRDRAIVNYTKGDCQKLVQKYDYENAKLENAYRMFADDAYMTILKNVAARTEQVKGIYIQIGTNSNTNAYTASAADTKISDTYAGIGLVFIK